MIVFVLYRATMHGFDVYLSGYSSSLTMPQLRGDIRPAILSDTVIKNPCDFSDSQLSCGNGTDDSKAVTTLAKEQLSNPVRKLIENHHYASAYDIARDLLAEGYDQEVLTLLRNDVFDAAPSDVTYKANFANRWYLVPAVAYAAHNREYDGVALFKQYIDIMRVPLQSGHWLSQPGLDATDMPPLVDLFCTNTDPLAYDECLLGILRLAVSSKASIPTDSDAYFRFDDSPPPDLSKVYNSLPAYLKTAQMQSYIAIWTWDGHSSPEPQHEELSKDQIAAWNYAFALQLLSGAAKTSDCMASITRSRELLSSVVANGEATDYFVSPAQHRIEFIDTNGEKLCEPKSEGAK